MTRPTVILDLASDNRLAKDLAVGGVFVPGCTLRLDQDCDLVVRAGADEVTVAARVVFVDPERGAGLELVQCSLEVKEQIAALARTVGINAPTATGDALAAAAAEALAAAGPDASPAMTDEELEAAAALVAPTITDDTLAAAAAEAVAAAAEPETAEEAEVERKIPRNVHERLRGLNLAQQVKLAHHGEIHERIVLERMYGKNVWEALLRNPKLTGPEVARIARMGALPRVLIEIIVGNGGWLQIPEVRRALLANPRLGTDQIIRVLRLLPKQELKIAAIQTAYPFAVRDQARRMIRPE